MVCYLRELAKHATQVAPGRAVVFVMDDCSVHICDEIVAERKRLRLALVITPARMTWALQPLDTHVAAC